MSEKNQIDSEESPSPEAYREMVELKRIGNRAVQQAQKENRRWGIPNVYSIRGHVYYERPDGTLTLEDPDPETDADGEDPER
jgi:hypothetical protein